ncbi:Putative transposase [Cyclobacterium lianum]|uniref:Putative transposase n=1 Tax=Cyclobacterium lianum TaxID=388280 RepID=A0A1M7Q7X9_9BACT|nr:Putative transposase [Cyclobacterium lianum]
MQQAYATPCVVFGEHPLSDARQVIHYMGQYSHRVAISNHRIKDISDTHATFQAKDCRDKAKTVRLPRVEFLPIRPINPIFQEF